MNTGDDTSSSDVQIINTFFSPIIDLCNIPSTPLFSGVLPSSSSNVEDVILMSSHVIDLSTPPQSKTRIRLKKRKIPSQHTTNLLASESSKRRKLRRGMKAPVATSTNLEENIKQESSDSEPHHTLNCSVCLDNILQREPTATKCGHVFCGTCIRKALFVSRKCPLCQKESRISELTRLFF